MTTLGAFLAARIAEDEAFVERAVKSYQHVFGIPHYFDPDPGREFPTPMVAMSPYAARAECEAKRRIIARHSVGSHGECVGCGYEGPNDQPAFDWYDCPELRDLALPYADHPEYREQWRPW